MKPTFALALIATAGMLAGCQSQPLTPAQEQAYERERQDLQYENAQQAAEFAEESDDIPEPKDGLDLQQMDM